MTEQLLSVGIDLGTTTTQMIVSRLKMENTAAPFTIPRMEIREREIVYRSAIHFTPLLSADRLDAAAIRDILKEEYARAGIKPEQVQTGAVIITGETARKENAREVLQVLAELAGEFVVATAGPALESVLAAKGAGADQYAKRRGVPVLHMDIGGGTSNLALFGTDGTLLETGCLNVGGRLMKFDADGIITYVSPVMHCLDTPEVGERVTPERLAPVIKRLVQVLEEAAGLRPVTSLLQAFITDRTVTLPGCEPVLSFSGGVADLIGSGEEDWLKYGDIGVLLGKEIHKSGLCGRNYVLGQETLRATVIGAGSYSTELSGSTIAYWGVHFPMQNLPVVMLRPEELRTDHASECVRKKMSLYGEEAVAFFLEGNLAGSYEELNNLARQIETCVPEGEHPIVVVLEQDAAKALGQALQCRLQGRRGVLCLDGIRLREGSYLDVGAPVAGGTAIPVVIKTLAFSS